MTADPTTGGETHSYIYTIDDPIAGEAYIYYCLPLRDGALPAERRFIRYKLTMPAYSPGERPYWAKLLTLPMPVQQLTSENPLGRALLSQARQASRQEIHQFYLDRQDTIVLYLHRDVGVEAIEPDSLLGVRPQRALRDRYAPEVLYRRVQHREEIPQFSVEGQSVHENRTERRLISRRHSMVYAGVPISGSRAIVLKKEPTKSGGLKLTFVDQWKGTSGRRDPARILRILAVVDLLPRDAKDKVAWFVKMSDGPVRRGKYRVDIVFSPNVRVLVHRPMSLAGPSYDIDHLELNFEPKPHDDVYLPTYSGNIRFRGLQIALRLGQVEQQILTDSSVVQNERTALDFLVGFTPLVGDLIDIGELLYASITRRDRWNNHVSDEQFLLIALAAVLPVATSPLLRRAARRSLDTHAETQIAMYRRRIDRVWDSRYPREIQAVGSGEPPSLSAIASMQGPRDLSLAKLLR